MNSIFEQSPNTFTQIIEIGQAHDGSFGILNSMVETLCSFGVPIIKFQMHHSFYESSESDSFRVPFSYVDDTRADYWRRMELSDDNWQFLRNKIERLGSSFLCTPFSLYSARKLVDLGIKTVKIGSGDVDNDALLDYLSLNGVNIIMSSGMDHLEYVVDKLVQLKSRSNIQVAAMHCISSYPSAFNDLSFSYLKDYLPHAPIPIGYSDHSGSPLPLLIAQSIGCTFGEAHFTFSKNMFGPDSSSSLDESDLQYLLTSQSHISQMFSGNNKDLDKLKNTKLLFGRSLKAITDIPAGTVLSLDMIDTAKPSGHGIPASQYLDVIGRTAIVDIPESSFIQSKYLE